MEGRIRLDPFFFPPVLGTTTNHPCKQRRKEELEKGRRGKES